MFRKNHEPKLDKDGKWHFYDEDGNEVELVDDDKEANNKSGCFKNCLKN